MGPLAGEPGWRRLTAGFDASRAARGSPGPAGTRWDAHDGLNTAESGRPCQDGAKCWGRAAGPGAGPAGGPFRPRRRRGPGIRGRRRQEGPWRHEAEVGGLGGGFGGVNTALVLDRALRRRRALDVTR